MYNCLVCNVIIYVHVCTLMKSEFSDAKYKSMHVCVMYAALPNLIIAHLASCQYGCIRFILGFIV